MTTKRLQDAAETLAHALGHKDVGSTDPGAIEDFKASATPEQLEKFKNSWREVDARNFIMKTLRELRGEMLAGKTPDIDGIAKAAAEHLGDTEAEEQADFAPIKAALLAEQAAFGKELAENAEALRKGFVRYNLGENLDPSRLMGKNPTQIATILAAHQAVPVDEFVPTEKSGKLVNAR
ncbi:MAG TPA: hypothetical protein VG734_25805 [Lacunisphaera sp.]|nr:hypothetical protein [Lacunisphaera sp.]